jgi:glutaryl-CoA dehydrogenase
LGDLGHALATEYCFLREQLSDEQLEVLRRVRLFVDDEVLPVIGGCWERAEMPWPLIRPLGELGGHARWQRDTARDVCLPDRA